MKQGRASTSGSAGQKREPIKHPISPKVAGGIGHQTVRTKGVKNDPHGFLPPPTKIKGHPNGSQGGY